MTPAVPASAVTAEPWIWSLLPIPVLVILLFLLLLLISGVSLKRRQGKKPEKTVPESPVIGTPTDNGASSGARLSHHTRSCSKTFVSFLFR